MSIMATGSQSMPDVNEAVVAHPPGPAPDIAISRRARRSVESYEREIAKYQRLDIQLRQALAHAETLSRQKDELIERQQLLANESDHRLLNDLQMIVSLLSMQSRASTTTGAAAQLAAAANRVAMIASIHRRLRSFHSVQAIAFKTFLEEFGHDFSSMMSYEEHPAQVIVEGIDLELPTATAIPLAFIVSELITNAAKYGNGAITVELAKNGDHGHALTVSNDGPALPVGFDPAASKGLGMKIIRSFVKQVGGELRIGPNTRNQGARISVLFA